MQRRIPADDAINSPNERMPTRATGWFAPATPRHPPLSRRTRRVLASTASHDRFDLSCASIRRVRHVHFFSCRATHERRARPPTDEPLDPAIDASSLTHFSFWHPTIFRLFPQHSVIDRMTATSHLSTDFI
ncbi:TPA: hypothetical protein QDB48_005620 [Burkholderia vietnamiensis]|nr:hypothetical protein [Burkholderia vietnamiensis]